mgnify:FL=1
MPFDCIKSFNKQEFLERDISQNGQLLSKSFTVNNPIPGLKSIQVNELTDQVTIETSAKILKDNYLQGINLNTLGQYIDSINGTNLVYIMSDKIDQATCLKIDTTQNIEWHKTKPIDVIQSIHLSAINDNYHNTIYNSKTEKSIRCKGKQKTINSTLTIYYKYLELMTAKNKDFLKSCNRPGKMLQDSETIMRVEQNTTALKEMRNRLKIADTNLMSVLTSTANTNFDLLNTITSVKSVEQLEFWNRFKDQDITPGEIFIRIGKEGVIKSCGYDSKLIKEWLKSRTEYWSSYWYDRKNTKGEVVKGLKSVLREMRFRNNGKANFYFDTFNEFRNLVRVA